MNCNANSNFSVPNKPSYSLDDRLMGPTETGVDNMKCSLSFISFALCSSVFTPLFYSTIIGRMSKGQQMIACMTLNFQMI